MSTKWTSDKKRSHLGLGNGVTGASRPQVVGEALVRAWLEARDAGFPEEGVVSGAHASSAATRSNAGVGRRNEAGGPKQGCERRGSVAAVLEGGGGGLGDGGGVVPEGVWIPAEVAQPPPFQTHSCVFEAGLWGLGHGSWNAQICLS